jgi:hypothetical protein
MTTTPPHQHRGSSRPRRLPLSTGATARQASCRCRIFINTAVDHFCWRGSAERAHVAANRLPGRITVAARAHQLGFEQRRLRQLARNNALFSEDSLRPV